jgi:hypothetical protein
VLGRRQWQATWVDDAGVTGKSRPQPQYRLPAPQAAITVYADPDGTLPPVWEGDSGSR